MTAIVEEYIRSTYDSLHHIDKAYLASFISDDFIFDDGVRIFRKSEFLESYFPEVPVIVENSVNINSIALASEHTVLADWQIHFKNKDDTEIFQMFANFDVINNVITKITQRSDSLSKMLDLCIHNAGDNSNEFKDVHECVDDNNNNSKQDHSKRSNAPRGGRRGRLGRGRLGRGDGCWERPMHKI